MCFLSSSLGFYLSLLFLSHAVKGCVCLELPSLDRSKPDKRRQDKAGERKRKEERTRGVRKCLRCRLLSLNEENRIMAAVVLLCLQVHPPNRDCMHARRARRSSIQKSIATPHTKLYKETQKKNKEKMKRKRRRERLDDEI